MRGPTNQELTKEVLQRLYVDDPFASLESVGKQLGVSRGIVRRALLFHGFDVRPRARRTGVGLKPHTKLLSDQAWLRNELQTKNIAQIARDLDCPDDTVFWWAKKHGLVAVNESKSAAIKEALRKARPDGFGGDKASGWKGGRIIRKGYVKVFVPDHPNAKNGYMFEHRLVMEKHLGRYLESDEIVHHIDGNKANNAIENLRLTHNGEHISGHFKDSHEVKQMRSRIAELEAELEAKNKEIAQLKEQLSSL